jgi:nucleotide-binding universal stress UspA family protein
MRVRKLLCPIDFSPASRQALRTAIWLANDSGAELVVAHAWHMPPLAYAPEVVWSTDMIARLRDDAEHELVAAVDEARTHGARNVSPLFLSGVPWDRVVYALESDPAYDLAVVGTRGRSALAQVVLGSVAENIVRHAPCSILVVPPDRTAGPFEHALCPIDFSESSRYGAELAVSMVRPGGRGITLAHVVEFPTPLREHRDEAFGDPITGVSHGATELLDRWANELRGELGATVATRTEIGHPTERILAILDTDPSYDLVVTGSRGRGGVRRLLLGSVAEQVVRHARKPVLVARRR